MERIPIKSLVVGRGQQAREEIDSASPFGPNTENPISRLMPGLHVFKDNRCIRIFLESPVVGGPVAVATDRVDKLVIPGEPIILRSKKATLFIKVLDVIQMIFVE